DVDPRRQHETARMTRMAALADEHQQLSIGVEDLEISERGVDDVDVAVVVCGDAAGAGELAREAADRAEAGEEATVGVEGLNAEVAAVDDVQPPVLADRRLQRQVELAFLRAATADHPAV